MDRIQTVLHDAPTPASVPTELSVLLCQNGDHSVNATGWPGAMPKPECATRHTFHDRIMTMTQVPAANLTSVRLAATDAMRQSSLKTKTASAEAISGSRIVLAMLA